MAQMKQMRRLAGAWPHGNKEGGRRSDDDGSEGIYNKYGSSRQRKREREGCIVSLP